MFYLGIGALGIEPQTSQFSPVSPQGLTCRISFSLCHTLRSIMADWDKETGEQKGPLLQLPPVSAWSKRTLERENPLPRPKASLGKS